MELIKKQQLEYILKDVAADAIQRMKDHITEQKEVGGGDFPELNPKTIKQKEKHKRGGVRGNAKNRMKATGDFSHNAFEYKLNGDNSVTISISKKIHKLDKIANERKKWETNKAKGNKVKTPKPTYTNKQGKITTYEDIAKYNLRGEYDKGGWRKAGNPGADFFGLSKKDEAELKEILANKLAPTIEQNIADILKKSIK
jgi:hypothetical protein